ncbi:MAG: type I 3-dehydroquinate dehydratase [Acidobacteriota bacterium]
MKLPGPLCGVVSEASVRAAIAEVRTASRLADVCEVRVDAIRSGDLAELFERFACPLILTVRARGEGGQFVGDERERRALLGRLLRDSPHWVDVEMSLPERERRRLLESGRVLISLHDFTRTPRSIGGVLRRMRAAAGEAPVKYVCTARRLADAVAVRRALERSRGPTVLFAMGDPGVPTRILAPAWGSALTYGAVRPGRRTAAGQPTLAELAGLFRVRTIDSSTRLYAVAGTHVSGSLSPLLHNTIFGREGVDAVYTIAPAARLDDVLGAADALGLRGLSITAPFKQAALAAAATAT